MNSHDRFAVKRAPRNAIVAGLLLAAIASNACAFQPLITDDTGTQGLRGNQIELSVTEDRESTVGDSDRIRTLQGVYSRGLNDTLDVYVGVSHIGIRSPASGSNAGGAGNPALGLKWRFYENEDSKTSFGLKPEIRLPISAAKEAAGLGTGKTSYGLTLILTQELPFGAVHANLSRGRDLFLDADTNPHTTTNHVSIAPVWDVAEEWKLALDLGREFLYTCATRTRANFTEFGAIYSPSKDLDFALGIIRRNENTTPTTTTTSATLGVTWRFK